MHLPSLNPRLKSEKVPSNCYSVRSLQKTSWQPRSSRRSPNTGSTWQSQKVSHWAIHKLVMDSWFLTSNLWATLNLTCSHPWVRNFNWEVGWQCLSLSFSMCTHPKDHRINTSLQGKTLLAMNHEISRAWLHFKHIAQPSTILSDFANHILRHRLLNLIRKYLKSNCAKLLFYTCNKVNSRSTSSQSMHRTLS
jgi:hypothetical protein